MTTLWTTPPKTQFSLYSLHQLRIYFTFYIQSSGTYCSLTHSSLLYVSVVNNANNFRMFTLTGNRRFSFNSSFKGSCGALFF